MSLVHEMPLSSTPDRFIWPPKAPACVQHMKWWGTAHFREWFSPPASCISLSVTTSYKGSDS
eukprot:3374824-Prymnesium_polylepis.2